MLQVKPEPKEEKKPKKKKDQTKVIWLVLLFLDIVGAIVANELGYGIIALAPCLLLGYWFMTKVFEKEKPSD